MTTRVSSLASSTEPSAIPPSLTDTTPIELELESHVSWWVVAGGWLVHLPQAPAHTRAAVRASARRGRNGDPPRLRGVPQRHRHQYAVRHSCARGLPQSSLTLPLFTPGGGSTTGKGRVWSWGAGDCGQLGARPTTAGGSAVLVAFPREGGTALPAVDKLVCGAYHSFVLSTGTCQPIGQGSPPPRLGAHHDGHHHRRPTDGALYGWGQGTDGQLGSGRRHNELTPIRVALADGQRVTDVGAGWGHSVFLTTPIAS